MTAFTRINTVRITLTSFLAYFVLSAIISPLGIVSQPIALHYGVSVSQATAIFSYFTTGILLGSLMAVFIFDYLKIKWVVILSALLVMASLCGAYAVDSFALLPLFLFFSGLGCGVDLSSAAVVITRSYSEKLRPSMLLLTDSSYSGAASLSTFLASMFVASSHAWFSVYALGVLAVALLLLLALLSTYPARNVSVYQGDDNLKWPLSVYSCGAALLFYLLGMVVIYSWVPSYAQTVLGFNSEDAGNLVFQLFSGMFVGQLVLFLLVLFLPIKLLIIACCVGAVGLSTLLWNSPSFDVSVIMFCLGLVSGGILKVTIAHGTTLTRESSPKMVSYFLLNTSLGTAIAPALSSWIVDAMGLTKVMMFATLCYAATGFLLLLSFVMTRAIKHPLTDTSNVTDSVTE